MEDVSCVCVSFLKKRSIPSRDSPLAFWSPADPSTMAFFGKCDPGLGKRGWGRHLWMQAMLLLLLLHYRLSQARPKTLELGHSLSAWSWGGGNHDSWCREELKPLWPWRLEGKGESAWASMASSSGISQGCIKQDDALCSLNNLSWRDE